MTVVFPSRCLFRIGELSHLQNLRKATGHCLCSILNEAWKPRHPSGAAKVRPVACEKQKDLGGMVLVSLCGKCKWGDPTSWIVLCVCSLFLQAKPTPPLPKSLQPTKKFWQSGVYKWLSSLRGERVKPKKGRERGSGPCFRLEGNGPHIGSGGGEPTPKVSSLLASVQFTQDANLLEKCLDVACNAVWTLTKTHVLRERATNTKAPSYGGMEWIAVRSPSAAGSGREAFQSKSDGNPTPFVSTK